MSKKNKGFQCPECGKIAGIIDKYEMDIDCLWVRVICGECGETWSEYHKLQYDGYSHQGCAYDTNGDEIDE